MRNNCEPACAQGCTKGWNGDEMNRAYAVEMATGHIRNAQLLLGDTPTPETLTIYQAQTNQPWTVPYGANKWWVTNNEGRLKHCLAHAQKSLGKIATIIEKLDHEDHQWLSDAECDAIGDMAADLVSVALQIGTVVSRSVAHALVRRVTEKNGTPLDPKGGTYGRALICK